MTQSSIEEKIQELKARLAKNPECGVTNYNLGVHYMALRDFETARQYLQEAIRKSPDLAEAYVQLGGIAMNEGDLDGCFSYN